MVIHVQISFYFYIFSFSLVLKRDFIRCVDFTHIATLSTNQVTRRIFNTYLLYYCAHFVVEIDEKSSLSGGFKGDLMMIRDSGLLFLGHPVYILHLFTLTFYMDLRCMETCLSVILISLPNLIIKFCVLHRKSHIIAVMNAYYSAAD